MRNTILVGILGSFICGNLLYYGSTKDCVGMVLTLSGGLLFYLVGLYIGFKNGWEGALEDKPK